MFEKIKACYDYECVWNEWDSPYFYKQHKSDDNAFILGERMENKGVKFVKHELHGRNDAIDEVMKLQADLENKTEALEKYKSIEENDWDLRCVDVPTGEDYDIEWHVVEHYMAKPKERIIGYGKTPLEAIEQALKGGEVNE